jgi:hypothetical protein
VEDAPVVTIDEEETSVQEKDDFLPKIDDVASDDEALPLPLAHTAVAPDPQVRNTVPAGVPQRPPTPSPQGVTMPSNKRKVRGGRSVPPAPPSSNRSALPKPSSPPRKSNKGRSAPDIQAHDSVDVQLDELLKSD